MAIAAIAIGNLRSPAQYVSSFHAQVFSDSSYTTMVGSKISSAVKEGSDWVQGDLMSFPGLVRGQTYYIQAGPVSPGGQANFNRFSVQAGVITVPATSYTGTFTATSSGVTYDISVINSPADIDHYEAIWTKDGSAPSNSSLINNWQGSPMTNGTMHLFVGGFSGQTIHLFMRGVSTSGGYQNWVAVDNRTVVAGSSGSTNAAGIFYADGSTVESLKPGQAGADVTGTNVAADTQAVNGINSGHISDTSMSVGFLGKWWRTSSTNKFPVGGGEYSYAPMFTTQDSKINYNLWGTTGFLGASPLPPVPSGNGSWLYVRWTGYFTCTQDGTYKFGTNSDDGSNLIINGFYCVNDLASRHGVSSGNLVYQNSGNVYLFAGHTYPVVVEYHQEDNNGGIQVLFTPPGGSPQLLDVGTAFANAAFTQYADGTPVNALQPASAGADVTAVNVSADTSKVGGRNANDVAQTVLSGGGVDYLHVGNQNIPQNGNSLLIRGSFEDGSVGTWGPYTAVAASTGTDFGHALTTWARDTFEGGNDFPVSAGQRIYCYGKGSTALIPAGYGYCAIGIAWKNSAGNYMGFDAVAKMDPQQSWTSLSGYVNVPSGAATGIPWLQIDHVPNNLNPACTFWVAQLFYSKTAVVDFSESAHINKNAANIPYTDGATIQSLRPAQVGADATKSQAIVYAGASNNLVPNGAFLLGNADGWAVNSGTSFNGNMNFGAGGVAVSQSFEVQPGNRYKVSFFMGKIEGGDRSYLRIVWGSSYQQNIMVSGPGYMGYKDFEQEAGLLFPLTEYTYGVGTDDAWVAPAGAHYASLAIYNIGQGTTYLTKAVVQDLSAARQWGADVTGANTAANTNYVGSTPASVVSQVLPNGSIVILNGAGRIFSLQSG